MAGNRPATMAPPAPRQRTGDRLAASGLVALALRTKGNGPGAPSVRQGRPDVCATGGPWWHAKPNHLFGFRSRRAVSNFDQTMRQRTARFDGVGAGRSA
jgi:hypothetical protein